MRILAALFDHRGVEFSVSDLAHATGVAIATASREVERLESHGLVTSRNIGRSRFVSANWDLVWADSLATILAYTAGLPGRIAHLLRDVPGVDAAFIYGSWAVRPPESELTLEINPVVVSGDEWARSEDAFLDELRSRPMFQLDLSAARDA